MDRNEVIKNLRMHIKNMRIDNRSVSRQWCIRYLMDFLLIKKQEAIEIFENEVI